MIPSRHPRASLPDGISSVMKGIKAGLDGAEVNDVRCVPADGGFVEIAGGVFECFLRCSGFGSADAITG